MKKTKNNKPSPNNKIVLKPKSDEHASPNCINMMPHISFPQRNRQHQLRKVYDLALLALSPSTTTTLTALFSPGQNVAVNGRTGDFTYSDALEFTYTIACANADLYTTVRVQIIQWYENNGLVAPTAAILFQLAADGIYAMPDLNYSNQYHIVYDRLHSFAGLATAPTSSSNQAVHMVLRAPSQFRPKNTFTVGAATCDNCLYLVVTSDSAIAPFPVMNFKSRQVFQED